MPADSLTIRLTFEDPRTPAAQALIRALSAEIAQRYHDDDGSGGFSPEDVLVPRAAFVVAWLDDLPVGCGALRPVEDGVAEVKRMYVVPAYRGRRIAQSILEKLEEAARSFGYRAIKLETGTVQPEAMRLYERMGYHRIPNYGEYAESELTVCYGKELG